MNTLIFNGYQIRAPWGAIYPAQYIGDKSSMLENQDLIISHKKEALPWPISNGYFNQQDDCKPLQYCFELTPNNLVNLRVKTISIFNTRPANAIGIKVEKRFFNDLESKATIYNKFNLNVRNSTPWMQTVKAEIGQKEIAGKKANPKILEYFKASKFWGTDDSGGQNAWCGSFVAWVMKENGHSPVKSAYRAKEWLNFGKKLKTPIYGAIGIKSRKGGGHVAFVVGKSQDGEFLFMLGGNQGDQVKVSKYKASVWDTFVVPSNYNPALDSLPVYTKQAAISGSES